MAILIDVDPEDDDTAREGEVMCSDCQSRFVIWVRPGEFTRGEVSYCPVCSAGLQDEISERQR